MKYSDLIVLSYRSQLNLVNDDGKIVSTDKDDDSHVKYISQGFVVDLQHERYKTRFGPRADGAWIGLKDGWYKIGHSIIMCEGAGDGLLGVYNRNSFMHLERMINDVVTANTDYSNAD
jgi:hypothetical protein